MTEVNVRVTDRDGENEKIIRCVVQVRVDIYSTIIYTADDDCEVFRNNDCIIEFI